MLARAEETARAGAGDDLAAVRALIQEVGHVTGSEAIANALFKMDVEAVETQVDATWLRGFFERHADMLAKGYPFTDAMAEKRGWFDAEARLRELLSLRRTRDGATVSKPELWREVQECGGLEGSTALTRARRLLESEAALARECAAEADRREAAARPAALEV